MCGDKVCTLCKTNILDHIHLAFRWVRVGKQIKPLNSTADSACGGWRLWEVLLPVDIQSGCSLGLLPCGPPQVLLI